MKKLVLIAFVVSAMAAMAQSRSSVETQALQQELSRTKSVSALPKSLSDRYPIRYHNGVASIGVVAKVDASFSADAISQLGGQVTSRVADIASIRIPLMSLSALSQVPGMLQYSVAHHVAPEMKNTRFDTRTDSVQAGLGLPQAFDGEGVLVGITDWGFDYRHPNINSSEERRILRAWDHFKLSGPAPAGFDYGTEFKTYDEIYEAGGDTSGLYEYGSHGTHVAGIIGGRGVKPAGSDNNNLRGQAPKVQYLLGSWLLDEAAWLDQVAWMYSVAKEEQKRLVINSSWGMYTFSNLDGTSLLSQAIGHYSDSGVVFVTSAGNNGDSRFHVHHTFGNNDEFRTIPNWIGANGVGQAIICWGTPDKPFSLQLALIGNMVADTIWSPVWSTTQDNPFQEYRIVNAEGDTCRFDVMIESSNMNDQRPHILLNVDKIPRYKPLLIVNADSTATIDMWNVGNVQNHAGNTGYDFVALPVLRAVGGDLRCQVSEPGCAPKTITVAAHEADHATDTSYTTGSLTYFSSNGPAFGGMAKPEVSAPGYQVISSVSSRDHTNYSAAAALTIDGTKYKWSAMSGTSMSSPAVTGIVALMLQANPDITVDQIREIIFTTARNDDKTGSIHAQGAADNSWGWGKIDAMRCVAAAYDLNGIERAVANMPSLVVYPNPATDQVSIVTSTNEPSELTVFGIDGRVVLRQTIGNEAVINAGKWAKGVYMLQVRSRVGVRTSRLIVR
ncbi:MAG: S8 family peptidase [Bacteroidales bacterium]|nr:S8 family peptidase [Bacteroidales bacterium]